MHIKSLVKQFEEIMSSVAFAEAGEVGSAIKILHERHKVLLVLTGEETDMKAAKYALNICKRIRIGIEILYITKNNDEIPFLEEYLKELKTKGIEYQVRRVKESMKEEIIRFIEKEKNIQFVVIDSQDLGIDSATDKPETVKKWERLTCPLVLVSGFSKT
jgi:predicted nucleotide-binding protein (sugar kinase/HSP70/actin superfamily)